MAWTAAEFRDAAEAYATQHGVPVACVITDDDLRRVRDKRGELFARWAALPAGATLELIYGVQISGG